jgi:hypothetical protein
MFRKIVLSAAIVLTTAFPASAATKPRANSANAAVHNPSLDSTGNRCSASGGPSCSTACLPSGPPCRTAPDSW